MQYGSLGMGMDLSGRGGYFRWTTSSWFDLLEIAIDFDWEPLGTGPPRGTLKADWEHGSYVVNQGQLFYARDALAFANCLEQAVEAFSAGKVKKRTPAGRAFTRLTSMPSSGKNKKTRSTPPPVNVAALDAIREFIVFCRMGSFRIY